MPAMPELILKRLVRIGIDAITADLTVLDSIFDGIEDEVPGELDKIKAYWTDRPPDVMLGFARRSTTFPAYAVTLARDQVSQDFVGLGEEALLDDDDVKQGVIGKRRLTESFTIYVYAEHPDVCAWYYRVLKAIVNVGTRFLIKNDLDDPTMDGADLAPSEEYTPDNLFLRRLTVTVEHNECWTDRTALWQAVNGDPEDFLTPAGTIDVKHEDAGGGVTPYADE